VIDHLKEQNFVSVVAYIHQNASDIEKFYSTINNILKDNFNNFEIIFVDDASSDDSLDKIKSLHSTAGSLSIVQMSHFQ
jgi:glycosyltransferase involved in cell wall biosynthesis